MDKVKFDALTRAFATGTSRRTAIKGLFGGAVGIAVATTRLDRTGAQGIRCTPETVLDDCPLANECEWATCEQGVGTDSFFCEFHGGCQGECCGGVCQECCDSSDCGGCDICDSGTCVSGCTDCQVCHGTNGSSTCVDRSDGICCGGTWVPGGQCCDTLDCLEPAATFCSSVACIANLCTVIPECPDDQLCCGYGQEGAHCAQCCENIDCGPCESCESGQCVPFAEYCPETDECYNTSTGECCYDNECGCGECVQGQCTVPACCDNSDCTDPCTSCVGGECIPFAEYCPETDECYNTSTGECCYDNECGSEYCVEGECQACRNDTDCGDCAYCSNGTCYGECSQSQECCDDVCVDLGECCRGIGDYCGLLDVEAADYGSPQYDCCDGLVCCENWNSQGSVCAECCNDWDCAKGAYCHEGWCEYPDYCDHDKECPKGTCCCKDGSCSGKCCHHPHPPKPPKPAPPAPTPAPVTKLPATGAGPNDERNSLLGAAALGAAALFAAKKMRDDRAISEAPTEE